MEKQFIYKIKDGSTSEFVGEKVNICGSLVNIENPDGSADIYYPCVREIDYLSKQDEPDLVLLPVMVPQLDLVDARNTQDYADMFNGEDLEDMTRFKWLQGNSAMGLTLHLTDERTYATKADSFYIAGDTPIEGANVEFRFTHTYGEDVLPLLNVMGIKYETHYTMGFGMEEAVGEGVPCCTANCEPVSDDLPACTDNDSQ